MDKQSDLTVYEFTITKAALMGIDERERMFFVLLGFACNEIITLQKIVLAIEVFNRDTEGVEKQAYAVQGGFISRLLIAKMFEAWFDSLVSMEALDPALRNDVDHLAGHFHARGDFEPVFMLVPWNELVGPPNNGHAAIADLLISRGAHAALSANFDSMIERWAEERKIAMQGALTGQEAVGSAVTNNPLFPSARILPAPG